LALYKAEPLNAPGLYNSMLYGACLVALAVMNWSASKAGELEARHVVLGTFVAHAIALLVALFRQLTDPAVPPAAWLNVLLFLIFAVLFGYLQFAPADSRPATGSPA
jgi:glycerol uptake facilitator-like aquaporin